MGFDYLNGKRWSEVTRDERFFCMRLYELINKDSPESFVMFLCNTLKLDVLTEGEWETGFEVCFYRDLWQHRRQAGKPHSIKRTFDLCLFGEKAIIIIEAKAATGFDITQTEIFTQDIIEVAKLTNVDDVKLVGLCSSKYKVEPDIANLFDGQIVTWKEMASRYNNDEMLLRADDIYKDKRPFQDSYRYSSIRLSGTELNDAFRGGAKWWVGRGGGILGDRLKDDILTGRWREQRYEVNTSASQPPSSNYFSLEQFVDAVNDAESEGGDM